MLGLAALAVLCATAAPARAQDQVKTGLGFGLAFLPVYICQDLKLIEKRAKELHLDVKASYQRFVGAGPMQDAIASGAIDMGPYGTAPLLAAWEKAKDTLQQILAVSGITTMPLTLVSNRPNVATIADFQPTDRIAMPSLTAPPHFSTSNAPTRSPGCRPLLSSAARTVVRPANKMAANPKVTEAFIVETPSG